MALSSLHSNLASRRNRSPTLSPTLSPHTTRHSSFTAPQRTPPVTSAALLLLAPLNAALRPSLDPALDLTHPTSTATPITLSQPLTPHILNPTPTLCDLAYLHAPTAPTTAPLGLAGATLPARAPFASITRVLFTAQPSSFIRSLSRRPSPHVPTSVLVTLLALLATAAAAVRTYLVQKARCCRTCRGFGVMRCRVCDGAGKIEWQAKFGHQTCCPLCFNKRLMSCPDCGGFHHRPLFKHRSATVGPIEFKDAYKNDLT